MHEIYKNSDTRKYGSTTGLIYECKGIFHAKPFFSHSTGDIELNCDIKQVFHLLWTPLYTQKN